MNHQRMNNALMARAAGRSINGYCERHHVIPQALGGSNAKSNIVALTYREHFLAHWLLTKFTTGQARQKMLYALNRMTGTHSGRIVAGWQYERGRLAQCEARLGTKQSPEFIAAVAARMKGNQYGRGVKMTPDRIEEMRARLKGNKYSLGYKHSEETLEKRRANKRSEETRAKMSASHKRRWEKRDRFVSAETRAKMSEAVKRRPSASAETRARLSEASKAMWAARRAAVRN